MTHPLAMAMGAVWAAAVFAQPPTTPAQVPSPAPGLVVEEPTARFGEAYAGAEIVHVFALRNDGARPVRVLEVLPNTPPTRVDPLPGPIPPGGRAEVTVRQGTLGQLGVYVHRFLLKTDDGLPDRRLSLSGFLQSAYDPDQPILHGDAAPGAVLQLAVGSREVERLDVLKVEDAPAFLRVDTTGRNADGAVLLRAALAPDAPLGLHTGTLVLRTSLAHQPAITVPYRLVVFEDVAPEHAPVELGTLREGQPFEKKTRLRSRSGKPFEVTGVEGTDGVTGSAGPCPEPAPSCRVLSIKGVGPPATGRLLAGTVRVKLGEGRELTVPYSGFVLRADAPVPDIGPLGDPPSGPKPESALSYKVPTPPPVPPPVTGKPGERVARLTWDATQEEQSYGYLIYRADSREGPFRRVNARIVPVSEGPPPHRYTYEDRGVEAGRSYFYYLESISKGGPKARAVRRRHEGDPTGSVTPGLAAGRGVEREEDPERRAQHGAVREHPEQEHESQRREPAAARRRRAAGTGAGRPHPWSPARRPAAFHPWTLPSTMCPPGISGATWRTRTSKFPRPTPVSGCSRASSTARSQLPIDAQARRRVGATFQDALRADDDRAMERAR